MEMLIYFLAGFLIGLITGGYYGKRTCPYADIVDKKLSEPIDQFKDLVAADDSTDGIHPTDPPIRP